MRKSSLATSDSHTVSSRTPRATRMDGGLPIKTDRFPNQTQGTRGKNALLQTASLREFLGSKLPRKQAPEGLLTAIKEKIKAQQR